jgi:glycerol uptake facilitator-like aquaporin
MYILINIIEFIGTYLLILFRLQTGKINLLRFIIVILFLIISYFGSTISGSQFSPTVSLSAYLENKLTTKLLIMYILIQILAVLVAVITNRYINKINI